MWKKGGHPLATITLAINGKTITCRSGISVLEAARQNGITIPPFVITTIWLPTGVAAFAWWRMKNRVV